MRSRELSQSLEQCIHELLPSPGRIALYVALPDEADLTELMQRLEQDGYKLYLPRVLDKEQMAFFPYKLGDKLSLQHSFALLEPEEGEAIAPEKLELIVVPALAYDGEGYRLGRGAGYYDRYLSGVSCPTIGISLGLLSIEVLPRDEWDIPMTYVLRSASELNQ